MRKMAERALSQAALARRTGVGQATISRWIYKSGRPDAEKLRLLASSLDVEYKQLLSLAGYGEPAESLAEAIARLRVEEVDPLASELSAMLDEASALSDDDREFLRHTVNRLMDPYRKAMRRRRPA